MDSAVQADDTLTITPAGVAAPQASGSNRVLAFSTGDLQTLDRAIRRYDRSENKLVNASADLLALCGTLARVEGNVDVNAARVEISRSIIDLKYKVVQLDYPPSVAENLCLLFAIVIDEFVLLSPWGEDSGWENRTLVADLFGFRDGGHRFYKIADRALMQPRALREFLQIVYIFLKLGYRGRYSRGDEHERDRLMDRLETSMNLLPPEIPDDRPGRAPEVTRPPAVGVPTSRKLLFAVLAILAITLVMEFGRDQAIRRQRASLDTLRLAVADQGTPEYVYSSETGATEVKTGD